MCSPKPPSRPRKCHAVGARLLSAWAPLLLSQSPATTEATRPDPVPATPSFVLILADDLGWADVGYQGSSFCRTPHLDALARDGLAFSQAYAAGPVCSASRAALFSGRAPARLHLTDVIGLVSNAPSPKDFAPIHTRQRLSPKLPTLASALHAAGYRTGLIGKWHLGTDPREHGFEEVAGCTPGGSIPSYFDTKLDGLPPGEYLTERLTSAAVRFLEAHREDRFLLVLSHYAPHTPLEAPAAAVERWQKRATSTAQNHTYAAMVESLDASVGAIRAALERLELDQRTLLVFLSDNGGLEKYVEPGHGVVTVTSNAPLRGGKQTLYEGGIRVPLIFHGGPVCRRGTSDWPVVGTDLPLTLLSLAALAPLEKQDGIDFAPLLTSGSEPPPRKLYFHYPHLEPVSVVRDGDWKLLHFWRSGTSQLYSLRDDPGETTDLTAAQPERAEELRAELFAWLEDVGADVPGWEGRKPPR